MTDKTYDILAFIGRICLPALATFIVAFGDIWHLSYSNEIGATITAIATLINSILAKESKNYFNEPPEE